MTSETPLVGRVYLAPNKEAVDDYIKKLKPDDFVNIKNEVQMKKNEIITGAKQGLEAVLAARKSTYGVFADNATVAQNLKKAMHTDKYYKLSPDKQEALDQIMSKVSRIVTANCSEYKDSWTDIQGYAKLVADTLED